MSGGKFEGFRRLTHNDLLYLRLYRDFRVGARDRHGRRSRRASQTSVLWQYNWCLIVETIARFDAIFEKRPQFCPILVRTRRING
jgi:hypothetical protein